ncbi:hypothetical protein ACFC26_16070 [Kitasatospora purpeofusca]|uniref:hypothetical protein n=1 Tax=Kitasatospora purpeofusca TaxID=67352 RepID=UPI0035E07D29
MEGSALIALGSGGAATLTTLTLFVGIRGKGKIDIEDEHVPYWAFGIGLLANNAGSAFRSLGDIGTQLSTTMASNQALGEWKVGATAAVLTVLIFGLKPRPWKDALLGAVAPSLYTAAGGLFGIPVGVLGGLITSLVS